MIKYKISYLYKQSLEPMYRSANNKDYEIVKKRIKDKYAVELPVKL